MARKKIKINPRCVANTYASENECIAEVWSSPIPGVHAGRGCLISAREVENAGRGARGLIIEVSRADAAVFVRINGKDYRVPR